MCHWFRNPKLLLSMPLLMVLLVAAACGTTAPAEPVVVEKEVIKEVPKEVIKEVIVEKEVIKEVVKKVVVTPVPTRTPVPLVVIKSKSSSFPLKPDWVAKGKHQGMVLDIAARTNPGTWDVHSGSSMFATLVPSSPQFNQLVEFNPVNPSEIIGDLAESWEVNADGTVYTFRIHDATWSDGQPVTAEDILFSLDRITLPGAIRARTKVLTAYYEHGTGKVIDKKTVAVPLKFPAAAFLINLASDYMKMYPKHQGLTQKEANKAFGLIGSGPWILKEFESKSVYEYERNPNYFKTGRPFLDGLRFNILGRNIPRIYASLQVGQVFMTEAMSSTYVPVEVFKVQEESNGRIRALTMKDGSGSAWLLNISKPPFDDPRVRRAMYLAIDRNAAVDTIYCQNDYGQCFGSPGVFVHGKVNDEWVQDPDGLAKLPGYGLRLGGGRARDIAEAKALLAEAGYADGFKVLLNLSTSTRSVVRAELLTERLRQQFGIDFTMEPADRSTQAARMLDGSHHASDTTSAAIVPDAADNLNQHFLKDIVKNPDNWEEPEAAKLITAQERELDPAKRLAMLRRIVEILQKGESHYVPVLRFDQGGLMDYRIQNFVVAGSIQLVRKWDHIWWDDNAKCTHPKGCK